MSEKIRGGYQPDASSSPGNPPQGGSGIVMGKTRMGHHRGHPTVVDMADDPVLRYEETGEPAPNWQDADIPCGVCGRRPSAPGGADACLDWLPGVVDACCGHGDRERSYIRFANGVEVWGFIVKKEGRKTGMNGGTSESL